MTQLAPTRLKATQRLTAEQLETLPVFSIDTETVYSSDYSVADSSYYAYTHDPRFRCYLLSAEGPDGFEYVGPPEEFDWELVDGALWVSQNTPFDRAVISRLMELGKIPTVRPAYWADTSPLAAYLRAPRNLAGMVQALYGVTLSKEIRNRDMKGRQWEDFGPELQEKVKTYALDDARWCRRVWTENWKKWPDRERWISDMLAERGEHGFFIDQQSLDSDITFAEKIKFEAVQRIPWADEYQVLSPKALRAECAKHGIEAPKSLSQTDEACAAWEDQYGDQFEWIAAVRTWRRANTMLTRLKAIRDRIRPDGRMEFTLKFFGAHTGRSSGAGGFNMLNLPRAPFYITERYHIVHRKADLTRIEDYKRRHDDQLPDDIIRGIDFRSKFIPAPGHKLVVGDLAQIEARCARFIARDWNTLRMIEEGYGVYEAHARRFMGFSGEDMRKTDPGGYQLAKARELALGFGVGHTRFAEMARLYVDEAYYEKIFGAPVSDDACEAYLERMSKLRDPLQRASKLRHYKNANDYTRRVTVNSWLQVQDYRAKNPEIIAMWRRLDDELKQSVGETYEVVLPSGRSLRYFNVSCIDGSIQARVEIGGPFYFFFGSLIFENLTQALARDVFIEAQLRAEQAGINVILDVYDELVAECPLDFDKNRLKQVMTERPSWARRLPIGASVDEMMAYAK